MSERGSNFRLDGTSLQVKSTKYSGGCFKLNVYDWLNNIPETEISVDLVEVRFKNTRKSFYQNTNRLRLMIGDIIAVEASPGHDIGIVSSTS